MRVAGQSGARARRLGFLLLGTGLIASAGIYAGATPARLERPAPSALRFEPNQGQLDDHVRFLARGPGYAVQLTRAGATLVLQPRAGTAASTITMRIVGARAVEPTGADPLSGRSSYLVGDRARWRTGVGGYGRVHYRDVRTGVDVVYRSSDERQLEYDLVLAPGRDPGEVRVAFDGVERLTVDAAGSAVLGLPGGGELRKPAPVAYQESAAGDRVAVAARYRVAADGALAFDVGPHDARRALVIDPVLTYSSYLGGGGSDGAQALAVDPAGNIYVAGYTLSANFPTKAPLAGANAGSYDVFVSKLDPSGTSLVYSTYLGGSGEDRLTGLALDAAGNAYLTGYTTSANFPLVTPLQATYGGSTDAFVSKLDASGAALVYSTYLGAAGTDAAYAIAIDADRAVHVAGYTTSSNFPTAAPLQPALAGSSDAFVAKLNPAGSALAYATFLGGSGDEVARGIAVDRLGRPYVTGWTTSNNFPTALALQGALAGSSDAFVTRLEATGAALSYSTYLGGNQLDVAEAIVVDASFGAYVGGYTQSPNYPTFLAAQPGFGGTYDGFVTKLDPSGSAFGYSTYLGGSFYDHVYAIGVNAVGEAAVAGYTESFDFPTRQPLQPAHAGGVGDAFVSTLAATGSTLQMSTYLGGSSDDNAQALAVRPGRLLIAGRTKSTNFPVVSPLQGVSAAGPYDAFVAAIGSPTSIPATGRAALVALAAALLGLALVLLPRRRA